MDTLINTPVNTPLDTPFPLPFPPLAIPAARAGTLRRHRALVWLLTATGAVSVALLLVAILAGGRSTQAFQDVNRSGSLRFRSLWVYEAVNKPGTLTQGTGGWRAQMQEMAGIRDGLHARYPKAVEATDPAWNAFSGALRQTGRVDWRTADAMRVVADTLTHQIEHQAAAQERASAAMLRLGLAGLLCSLVAAGLLLARLRAAETEMRQSQASVQEGQDLFLRSINAVQEGYMVQDRDGIVLLCNAGVERLLGISAGDLIGHSTVRPNWRYLREDGEELPRALHPSRLALETAQPQEAMVIGIQQPGNEVNWFAMKAAPVFHAGQAAPYAAVLTFADITEKKKIEEQLQAEQEFQQAMLESLQSGIVACDADGILTLFNRAAREFHGLPEQPLPPEQWANHFDLFQPDGLTPLKTQDVPLFRAFSGEVVRDAEMVIAPKDRPSRTLLASGQAIFSRSGQKIGAVAAMHDITARRQTERELARLAAIVESSEEAILAATLDGTLVSWNAGAERLYGRPASEAIGRHVSVLTSAGEVSPVDTVIPRILRGEVIEPIEVVRRRPDGKVLDVALTFSPIYDDAGQIVGLSCISRDITARRQAENALRESEARLRYLSNAAFEGIAVSRNGVMLDANPAFLSLYGYETRDQIVGMAGTEFAAPESRALVSQKIAAGEEETYESLCLRRDGSTFQAEIRGRKVLWDGLPARVTAVRDVTERKALEENIRVSHHAVQESEARLTEAQRIAQIGSWEYDLVENKITWSKELFRLFEQDPADGEPDYAAAVALYHPEDIPRLDAHVARAVQEGIGYALDLRGAPGLVQDGPQKWYRMTGEAITDAGGRVIRLVGTLVDITERKEMEEKLRAGHRAVQESEARLAKAQQIAKVGSWEYDPVGGQVSWSGEMFRLLGRDPELGVPNFAEAMGHYHPDDAPMLKSLVARAAREGIGYKLDLRGNPRFFEGSPTRWYHTTGEVTLDASGRVLRLTGTLADVTDRKFMEDALRQSEEALRALMSSAPVILYAVDAAGIVTLSEGTGLAALGLAPGEAVGRSVFEFSGGDPTTDKNTRRALAGEIISYDAHYGTICLHVELRPQWDAAGNVTGIIGVCFDITERAQSEERFRVLFEQSSDAHLLFDGTGIIDCNNATITMLRCTDKSEVLALHPAVLSPEFQPDNQRSDVKCLAMDASAYEKGCHRFEWVHRKMNGEDFPVEVTLTPVTLQGKPVMLVVWHDLTERKKAEQEVRDYSVILEFQKSQLEEANRELEALATTDGLTGLKNHRTFQEKLAEEYARAARYHLPLSLLLLDVDQFKQYNDSFGHPAGDAVLIQVAALLGHTVRDTDIAARYGGEEFVVILPQTDEAGALAIAERVRAAIGEAAWEKRPITVSLGVCTLSLDTPAPGAMIACADKALYHSKTMGRNRVSHGNLETQDDPPLTVGAKRSRSARKAAEIYLPD